MRPAAAFALLSSVGAVLGAPAPPAYAIGGYESSEIVPRSRGKWESCGDALRADLFDSREWIGRFGEGKDRMCASDYLSGVFPNSIEAAHKDDKVAWFQITYTNGESKEVGVKPSKDDAHWGKVDWNPYRDSFSFFMTGTDEDFEFVRSLDIEVKGCEKGSGHPCSMKLGYDMGGLDFVEHPRGAGNAGMLLGAEISGDKDGLHGWTPHFTRSVVDKTIVTDASYSPSLMELNSMEMGPNRMTSTVVRTVIDNRKSKTQAKMQYESGRNVQKQTKFSLTSEQGLETGFEFGTSATVEINVGLPMIGGGGKVSSELSAKYDTKNTFKTIENSEEMKQVTDTSVFVIDKVVEAGVLLEATSTSIQATLDLDYDAKMEVFFGDRTSISFPIRGKLRQADYTEYITTFAEFSADEEYEEKVNIKLQDQPGVEIEDVTYYTAAGSFCPNGSRAGPFGMSKKDFVASCNL